MAIDIDFDQLVDQFGITRLDGVEGGKEQRDLVRVLDRRNNDQQASVDIDMFEKPQKITAIIGHKGEIAADNLWQQGAVTEPQQADVIDMRRRIAPLMGFTNQIGGQAFIEQKPDQSLPSASAQRRTASIPPKGSDG